MPAGNSSPKRQKRETPIVTNGTDSKTYVLFVLKSVRSVGSVLSLWLAVTVCGKLRAGR